MRNIDRYLSAATGVLTGLLIASQAQAYTLDAQHQQLADTLTVGGLRVYTDSTACGTGSAGFYNGTSVHLCKAGNRDRADYLDTLRHEAIHVAQRCNALNTGATTTLAVISTTAVAYGWEQYALQIVKYPAAEQSVEAEAWGAAKALSASDINKIVRHHCSFLF